MPLLWPAEDIGPGLQFHARGPGVIAAFAEEFSLEAAERRKNGGDAAPQEVTAKLRIFDARRAAFGTDDRTPKCAVLCVPGF